MKNMILILALLSLTITTLTLADPSWGIPDDAEVQTTINQEPVRLKNSKSIDVKELERLNDMPPVPSPTSTLYVDDTLKLNIKYNPAIRSGNQIDQEIVQLLKKAIKLKDTGKLNKVIEVLQQGKKNFPGNKEINKLLKEVQKQQSDARKKMIEGQTQWKNGMLDKAVSTLQKAVKIDPSNQRVGKVLMGMRGQKKMMNDALIKAEKLRGQKKFDQALYVLKKAGRISIKYLPYIEMIKKIQDEKDDNYP